MQSNRIEPFSDNWTYLKIELAWLDRVLGLAVARQRKDTKEIDRVARSRADRVTSHWWKGLIDLDSEIAYDSPSAMPRRQPSAPRVSYQQQLEAKIQVSQQRGVGLGLPLLCDRLQLNPFEKNLVLMALAPEISRRYGRIYNYLQETEQSGAAGLPTIDLILRILCHGEAEWRSARQCMATTSVLLRHQLLEAQPTQVESLLTRLVKLSDPLVSFLLADRPTLAALEALLEPTSTVPTLVITDSVPAVTLLNHWLPTTIISPQPVTQAWSDLILPAPLLASLQHLCNRIQWAHQVNDWGFQSAALEGELLGSIVLLIGPTGTGKTTAAQTIAQVLQTALVWVDLAVTPTDFARFMQVISDESPTVLLLKSAQIWLGRSTPLTDGQIHQFLALRRQQPGITLLSAQQKQTVKPRWQQQLSQLEFPVPNQASRLQLWQQAFPNSVSLDPAIDWAWLTHHRLTGGEIWTIAREAAFYAAQSSELKIEMSHLVKACKFHKGRHH